MVNDQNKVKQAGEMPAFFGSVESVGRSSRREEVLKRYRLVKGSKSPTHQESEFMTGFYRAKSGLRTRSDRNKPRPDHVFITGAKDHAEDVKGAGKFTVVGFREWSNEYRIRTEVTRVNKDAPPEQSGARVSEILSNRGARKIAESCEYMATKGGYSTFLTLTFDSEGRKRLDSFKAEPVQEVAISEALLFDGDFTRLNLETCRPYTPVNFSRRSTVQKEVSRFFDAAQKVFQRGWEYENEKGEIVKVAGHDGRLNYCWVCEVPDTIDKETGEVKGKNPHVHVLMQWRVDYVHFQAWAKRIESIWGQGVAHLEKIKEGEKAGAYMAKAAGYLCKAQGKSDGDQGVVYGNRYNISRDARAPEWVCIGRYELGRMGWLLSEAAAVFDERFGYVKKNRDALVKKMAKAETKEQRQKIGKILEGTRAKLKRMPRLSKYQAILKGPEQFSEFFGWAVSDKAGKPVEWLPEKPEGAGFKIVSGVGVWYDQFFRFRCESKEGRKWEPFINELKNDFYLIDQAFYYEQNSGLIPEYDDCRELETWH